ncbi:MAG: hypothetical protein VX320_02600 [Candidatus Thermoplasmatota archaeon]|nr:hypothetical protein [Candidatus Thermoplasmatota archaeon]MEE3082965.1 hypothetical protein [Candidatus Thermoplasmatota archaeon]
MNKSDSQIPAILMTVLFVISVWSFQISDTNYTDSELSQNISESSGGARHLYTFADGSSEAIALYQTGTPAKNVQISIPKGAEVTSAEVTISGASVTGWNSVTDSTRNDWMSGSSVDADGRSDSISLAFDGRSSWFNPHDFDTNPSSSNAWFDNSTYSIRQPHTTEVLEGNLSSQRSLQSGTMATYNGAVFNYRNMLFASTWDSRTLSTTIKTLYPSNGTQMTSGVNNQPIRPNLDVGSCSLPSFPNNYQYYGWRDWAVTDDERVFGILSTYRGQNTPQYHRIIEWDIRYPLAWRCISSYDISSGGYGDYSAISYDRTRDSIWVNHATMKSIIQYEFDGQGGYERNGTDYYTYQMSSPNQVRGMSVHGENVWFRVYNSWSSDKLEFWRMTSQPGSNLHKSSSTTIPANGYGVHYDGKRLNTLDHYSWTQGQRFREYGTGVPYLITAQPGTSVWVSETMETNDVIVAANMELSSSTSAAGDRVEYWLSSDNGTHWVSVTNNESVHFAHPGNKLKWKVQLVGTTAVSWWVSIEHTSAYKSTGEWVSPNTLTGTQVGQMRAQWSSTEPSGTEIGIKVTNDGGQNWAWVQNNVDKDWGTSVGNLLAYKVVMNTTDSSLTPSLNSMTLHYEEGYPSSVRIDVGDDGSDEYTGTGGLQDPVVIDGVELVDALNSHIIQNGEGTVNITFTVKAGSPGRIRLSDLDITYRFRTRVLDSSIEGNLLVPDGVDRILVTRIAKGDGVTQLSKVDVELHSSLGENPLLRWQSGNSCTEVDDPDYLVVFDTGNCTAIDEGNDIMAIHMPLKSNWAWNDESSTQAQVTVVDNLGPAVAAWETENLNLRVENDIQLHDLRAVDESGRELLFYDWMRGGQNITFTGSIGFEGTSLSPQAGQFSLEVYGQNLTQDGDPMGSEVLFYSEPNPAHGEYYIRFQTPLQSSQGGMLFSIRAVSLQNGSTYINPTFNVMRIVLDGNSPLVLSSTPEDGVELHAGSQPVTIILEDSVDPPTDINLHYWVESQDDLNYNSLPDADEYRVTILRFPENLPGGINVFGGIIDDSLNSHGEKVSYYVSGEDQQQNALAMGGGPVCPGFPVTCGFGAGEVEPNWNADLATYSIRNEFVPTIETQMSTILGHDDDSPLHPGTEYVARLSVSDGNGWQDIQSVHLSLVENFNDERASIWANFTRAELGHSMHLESGSSAVAVSNIYSSYSTDPTNESLLFLDIKFQLTWWFPEEFDTNGEGSFVPIVKIADWPCDIASENPCHEEVEGLSYDEWSLDNDLHFDMAAGHFTATDLATGRNLYQPGDAPELIAAGQVVRIEGRILFSEDATPAPEGAFDIVVGDVEISWNAVPREGGDFTLDILVPNVRSGGLNLFAELENLPGLATDVTETTPQIQLLVDGTPPEIHAVSPSGDISIDDSSSLLVGLHVSDSHGFDVNNPAEIHWKVRAGTSEISRGNQPFQSDVVIGIDWGWEGTIDLTDGGSVELLPGYLVDIWVTGSDFAGNPYLSENNTEQNPFAVWRLVRSGPEIDLRGEQTSIDWENPSPVGGETAVLSVSGVNEVDESGEVIFVLLEEISPGNWVLLRDISANTTIAGNEGWSVEIEVPTEVVEDEEIHRYQLVARDGHIDIDWVTIEPLAVKPHVARDGEALNNQIEQSTGLFVLYILALASMCFGVAMLVLYRREKLSAMEEDHFEDEETESTTAVEPPPGFENFPPPQQHVETTVPEPVQEPQWTDEQLAAAGWSPEQIATHKAQLTAATVGTNLRFNEAVVDRVMQKFGLTDRAKFLAYAEFFDADGNKYLKKEELEAAAQEIRSMGS